MSFFFSPSSIGYVFSAVVCWASAWEVYKSYKKSLLKETKIFIIALIHLGITVFLYGLPPFFFADSPIILGWFNVPANFFLGIWLAYMVRLIMRLNFPHKNAKVPFFLMLGWTLFILLPINIIYLPLPTFDKYGLEIWNYEWPLFVNTGLPILLVMWFMGGGMLYHLLFTEEKRLSALVIAISFFIGAVGGCLVTAAHTTSLAAPGYIMLFIGGFGAFLSVFLD